MVGTAASGGAVIVNLPGIPKEFRGHVLKGSTEVDLGREQLTQVPEWLSRPVKETYGPLFAHS